MAVEYGIHACKTPINGGGIGRSSGGLRRANRKNKKIKQSERKREGGENALPFPHCALFFFPFDYFIVIVVVLKIIVFYSHPPPLKNVLDPPMGDKVFVSVPTV